MKKTLFALFAVLLVLSLATCDFYELPPDRGGGLPAFPEDDGMVRLTINVGGEGTTGRALNKYNATTLPGAVADYYEVVFKFDNELYQLAFAADDSAEKRQISIPAANYGASGKDAIMFAGTESGKILLGVGEISAVDDIPNIKNITKPCTVTFLLYALENNVSENSESSTFKITGPTSATAYGSTILGSNYATGSGNPVSAIKTGPVFPVPGAGYPNPDPRDSATISATWSVTLPPRGDAIILRGNWTVTDITATAPVTLTGLAGSAVDGTVTCTPVTPETPSEGPALVSGPNPFTFDIDVSDCTDDGLCAIDINVPVRALKTTGTTVKDGKSLIEWNIKGGTDSNTPDNGNGKGAPVILGVGL